MAVLVIALAVPVPAAADGVDSMFGLMFRMMLTMMNVMSGAMLGNNMFGNNQGGNNWGNNFGNGFGGLNSFNLGMSAFPMMSGFGSPWNSFGGSSPWGGMSPWSGMSPGMGMSPWSTMSPWNSSGMSPWSSGGGNPFGGGFPGYSPAMQPGGYYPPYGGYDSPAEYGAYPPDYAYAPHAAYPAGSIIDGRWYGSSGEVLEIRGNRFRLQSGSDGLEGAITVENDIVSMFSPQTNSVTRYTFVRNQTGLLLQGVNGDVLRFTQNPVNGVVHVF
jgi:hypothetical protein